MNYIKYLFFLVVLFTLGLLLLGVFNPGFEVEHEEEIIATLAITWDQYQETSDWKEWKLSKDTKMEWQTGATLEEGATYQVTSAEEGPFVVSIVDVIKDSLMVAKSEFHDGATCLTTTTFTFKNGKCILNEKEEWQGSTFFQNISLNFSRSSLEKAVKLRLEALKKLIEEE